MDYLGLTDVHFIHSDINLLRDSSAGAMQAQDFALPGLSSAIRLLLVCHCYRGEANVIRIISARKATAKESINYP